MNLISSVQCFHLANREQKKPSALKSSLLAAGHFKFRPLATAVLLSCCFSFLAAQAQAQADSNNSIEAQLDAIELPPISLPLCFGLSDITEPQALEICDALSLRQNITARELSEDWLRAAPQSAAAQFALAEVLFSVEGNLPRALFHLNQAERLTNFESLVLAFESGMAQWHYLTLSQLAFVHQLMGNQLESLDYLAKIQSIYGQDTEAMRGWPLIKLKQYQRAHDSAMRVLRNNDSPRAQMQAWNTLCAVELARFEPIDANSACEQTLDTQETNTVYLANAAEVSLSLLQMQRAEDYLDRATRSLNPGSVADPWIQKLYLTLSASRFDAARSALDQMLIWREQQDPIINVMNRAEHMLVSAIFLMVAGYPEDAAKLSASALNQPDRNGSYSADNAQKDALAALINALAYEAQYQVVLEQIAGMGRLAALGRRIAASPLLIKAWRSKRRAAALFAQTEVLENRLRPYAPLDVHIPEWIEPELMELMGTGVMSVILEQAHRKGVFALNQGYYWAYKSEISALKNQAQASLSFGQQALAELPPQEQMLRARVNAHNGAAAWQLQQYDLALGYYQQALSGDPSIFRRLGSSIPVDLSGDNSTTSNSVISALKRSPRFRQHAQGFKLALSTAPLLSACLATAEGVTISCTQQSIDESLEPDAISSQFLNDFHRQLFSLNYDISKTQRSILLGSSVILDSQRNRQSQQQADAVLGN